jgi:histone acetyltransferase (RNA polymerase elongator complex component)
MGKVSLDILIKDIKLVLVLEATEARDLAVEVVGRGLKKSNIRELVKEALQLWRT